MPRMIKSKSKSKSNKMVNLTLLNDIPDVLIDMIGDFTGKQLIYKRMVRKCETRLISSRDRCPLCKQVDDRWGNNDCGCKYSDLFNYKKICDLTDIYGYNYKYGFLITRLDGMIKYKDKLVNKLDGITTKLMVVNNPEFIRCSNILDGEVYININNLTYKLLNKLFHFFMCNKSCYTNPFFKDMITTSVRFFQDYVINNPSILDDRDNYQLINRINDMLVLKNVKNWYVITPLQRIDNTLLSLPDTLTYDSDSDSDDDFIIR